MKSIVYCLAALSLLAVTGCMYRCSCPCNSATTSTHESAPAGSQGSLNFEPTEFDIDGIYHGEKRTVSIQLRNPGTTPVQIDSCRVSCPNCMQILSAPKRLNANETGEIKVEVNTLGLGLRSTYQRAVLLASKAIDSADLTHQQIPFTIHQIVIKTGFPVFTPEEIKIAPGKKEQTLTAILTNKGQAVLTIGEIHTPAGITVQFQKNSLNPGESTTATIQANPEEIDHTALSHDIVFFTNAPNAHPAAVLPCILQE